MVGDAHPVAASNPRKVLARRSAIRFEAPASASHGSAFTALRMGGAAFGREGDPFLNLDHFRMAGPTFPPHAHAGFSAVTYILPESNAGMRNRDSRGDSSVIAPGGLHWTAAGAGIVHEEVPERADVTVEGFQIFVRQPVAQENAAPTIHHVETDAVPVVNLGEGRVRVLGGAYDGRAAPFATPSPLTLLDITLAPGEPFTWSSEPDAADCAIYLFGGRLAIDTRTIDAPTLILFERGDAPVHLAALDRSRLLLLAGQPLGAPSYSNGPFVLSSQARLNDAVDRYHRGQMGVLR